MSNAIPVGTVTTILLNRGYHALIDIADFERVSAIKWRAHAKKDGTVYAEAHAPGSGHRGHSILMHRFILGYVPGDPRVDHKDGDGLHNWRSNLRPATNAENIRNQRPHKDKKGSKFKGVCRNKNGSYRAQITFNQKKKNLGSFNDEIQAARVYDAAAYKMHGEFARLNFVKHPWPERECGCFFNTELGYFMACSEACQREYVAWLEARRAA